MKNALFIIAGLRPGSPDYLTPAARNAIEQAEVLVGAGRLLELFPNHRGEKIIVGSDMKRSWMKSIQKAADAS